MWKVRIKSNLSSVSSQSDKTNRLLFSCWKFILALLEKYYIVRNFYIIVTRYVTNVREPQMRFELSNLLQSLLREKQVSFTNFAQKSANFRKIGQSKIIADGKPLFTKKIVAIGATNSANRADRKFFFSPPCARKMRIRARFFSASLARRRNFSCKVSRGIIFFQRGGDCGGEGEKNLVGRELQKNTTYKSCTSKSKLELTCRVRRTRKGIQLLPLLRRTVHHVIGHGFFLAGLLSFLA